MELPRAAAGLPEPEPSFWQTIDEGLGRIPLTLTPAARAAIDAHMRLLCAWNAHINLTALRSPEQMARGHVLDALICVPALRDLAPAAGPAPSVCELGSGGGFPGLPLAFTLPAGRAVLVDSIAKKADFLGHAIRAARTAAEAAGGKPPAVAARAGRAEVMADEPDQREAWDLVVARAVGSVAEVAELGLPLARHGGHVVVLKRDAGDGALDDEIARAAPIAEAAGGARPRIVRLAAAEGVGLVGHCLVVIDKRRTTPPHFPRPPGERRRAALA